MSLEYKHVCVYLVSFVLFQVKQVLALLFVFVVRRQESEAGDLSREAELQEVLDAQTHVGLVRRVRSVLSLLNDVRYLKVAIKCQKFDPDRYNMKFTKTCIIWYMNGVM